MKYKIKLPRILKIEKIDGYCIQCMFNNGESRLLDFKKIFNDWKLNENDIEYKLLDPNEFKKVELRNNTLSWPNIQIEIKNQNGQTEKHAYDIGPDTLYNLSQKLKKDEKKVGYLIRTARLEAGLTQEQLALRSGTTRFYISRIENNKTDVEISTFRKIVEAGLGRNLRMIIE